MRTIERMIFWPAIIAAAFMLILNAPVWAESPPVDEDMDACATLLGEGELCGWPQVAPDDLPDSDPLYDDDLLDDPPAPGEGQEAQNSNGDFDMGADSETECPIVIGEGVVCTGPVEVDMPGGAEVERPKDVADDAVECEVPVGEGVVGCGPEILNNEPAIPVGGQELRSSMMLFVPAISFQP